MSLPWLLDPLFIAFSHWIPRGRGRPEVQAGPPVSFPRARKILSYPGSSSVCPDSLVFGGWQAGDEYQFGVKEEILFQWEKIYLVLSTGVGMGGGCFYHGHWERPDRISTASMSLQIKQRLQAPGLRRQRR